jgi:hypothetical protein
MTCYPGSVGPPAPRDPAVVIASQTGELWQAVAAGDLTAEHLSVRGPAVLPIRRGGTPDDVGRAQLHSTTLLRRTQAVFGETSGSQDLGAAPAIVWMTDQNDLRNCWDFWNIRALCPIRFGSMPMILLPRDQIQHWIGFDQQFAHTLQRGDEFAPDVLLTSSDLPEAELEEVAHLLHLERSDDPVRRGHRSPAPMRTAPFTYRLATDIGRFVDFKRVYGTSTQVDIHIFAQGSTVRFASPVEFRAGATLMRLGGTPFNGLPRRKVVAQQVHPGAIWREDAVQISVYAKTQYTLEIRVPSLSEAAHALLAQVTTRYQLSDKGRLADGIQQNIDVAALRRPHVFDVIRQLTTPRTKQFLAEVKKQFKELAAELQDDAIVEQFRPLAAEWGGRAERRICAVSGLRGGATQDNVTALETLAGLRWAERGLRIKCTDCRIDSFLPLEGTGVRGAATCPGCGSAQAYASDKSGVSIFYRLDSLVDRASDQGVIPHLLTIAELSRRCPRSWFLPGVDVWFASEETNKEADIVGIYDGQLVVGEVKTSGSEFTDPELTKDVDVCHRLGADKFVMAATDSIADDRQSTARRLCEGSGIELVVLTATDLLPSP